MTERDISETFGDRFTEVEILRSVNREAARGLRMITTSQLTPKRLRPSFSLDVLDQIYQATMGRRSELGFGALAAEQGLAVTPDEMFRRVYLAGDEEAAERASRLGNELLSRELGISKLELERYLSGEGADPPSSNLIAAFFGR